MRSLPTLALLAGGLMLTCLPARAQTVVAEIAEIPGPGLYRQDFSLTRDVDVAIDAIGSGSVEKQALIAYAWILDLRTRQPAWRMEAERARAADKPFNLRESRTLRLSAGAYALYFAAYGGSFPVQKAIKILKMFNLGSVAISGGNRVRWDEYGDPAEWRASVRLADPSAGVEGVGRTLSEPDLGALIRIDRVGDNAYRRIGLDLSAAVRFRILALGEYASRDQGFADGGWIQERDGCGRVWEMTLVNTLPAGGAEKNRVFDSEITVPPGRYLVCYATDDSHAYGAWNSNPPYDPDSWGITLIPSSPLAPGVAHVTPNPSDENVIVRIDRVGDGDFRTADFRLRHAADLCIRALGEWDASNDRYLDYGWIEDANRLEKVWSMESDRGIYAAGESRNRLVEDRVHLEPGTYRVCYVTDEEHSAAGWHDHPPFDPEAWGIMVRGARGFSADWASPVDEAQEDRTIIRLAPMRDDQERTVRFEVPERLTVKLIALGEGEDGEMVDYGWLDRDPGGEPVWVMRYADTQHAGGDEKNRRQERLLTLGESRHGR